MDDDCVTVIVGRNNSEVSIDGTFCTFNDCADSDNVIAVNNVCMEGRESNMESSSSRTPLAEAIVFPNPTTGEATISFRTETEGNVNITLTDLSGKASVISNTYMNAGVQHVEVDLSGFAP